VARTRVEITEKRFALPNEALEDLATRLSCTRVPADLGAGWDQGVPTGWLRGLLDDWRAFDPAALQRRLDGLPAPGRDRRADSARGDC
jgi:hypothetical protein